VSLPGTPATVGCVARRYLLVEQRAARPQFRLFSHFSRFSVAHRRPVGYENLIRGTDSSKGLLATELLAKAPAGVPRMQLDRQCRTLRVELPGAGRGELALLNVDRHIAVRVSSSARLLNARAGLPAHRWQWVIGRV
jgi:hypothetical protein